MDLPVWTQLLKNYWKQDKQDFPNHLSHWSATQTFWSGLSDYDFIQSPANCITSDFNCYQQARAQRVWTRVKGCDRRDSGKCMTIDWFDSWHPLPSQSGWLHSGVLSELSSLSQWEKSLSDFRILSSLPTNLTLPFILHLWALPTSFGQHTVPLQVSKVFWQQRVIRSSRRSLWHIMGHDFY